MSDWRDNKGYYYNTEPCDVCGSTDIIGTEPRFNYHVCEKHSTMPPVKLIKFRDSVDIPKLFSSVIKL